MFKTVKFGFQDLVSTNFSSHMSHTYSRFIHKVLVPEHSKSSSIAVIKLFLNFGKKDLTENLSTMQSS